MLSMANSAPVAIGQQPGALLLSHQVVSNYLAIAAIHDESQRRDHVVSMLCSLGAVINSLHLQQLVHWGAWVRWVATTQQRKFSDAASALMIQLSNDSRLQMQQLATLNTARMRVALLMDDESDDVFWLNLIIQHSKLSLNMLKELVKPINRKAWEHLPQPQRHEFWRQLFATSDSNTKVAANCQGTTHTQCRAATVCRIC
jgi:hypothetical protein